jgi:WD40 repeat protein
MASEKCTGGCVCCHGKGRSKAMTKDSMWSFLIALVTLAASDVALGDEPAADSAKAREAEDRSQHEFGSVRVHSVRTIAQRGALRWSLAGHRSVVTAVAFLPDGQRLLSLSNDSHIRLWDLGSGECVQESRVEGGSDMLALSPDGKSLAVSTLDGAVALLDVPIAGSSSEEFRRFEQAHSRRIAGLAFSPRGDLLASASHDGTSVIWDVKTGRQLRRVEGGPGASHDVCFAPNGRRIITAGNNKLVRVCDVAEGFLVRACVGHESEVLTARVAHDGQSILSGGFDKALRLWNYSTSREMRRFTGHTGAIRAVAFSPDGTLAASASEDHTVRLWDIQTGVALQTLQGHNDYVVAVAFSPDGKLLASAGGGDVSYEPGAPQGKWVPGDDYAIRIWLTPVFNNPSVAQ